MKRKKEVEQKIVQALLEEADTIVVEEELKNKILSSIMNTQDKKDSKRIRPVLSKKRVVLLAATFCILIGSTAFAYSFRHVTTLVSMVGPGYRSEKFVDIGTAEQKLGYEVDKVEAFSNGYQFKKMYVEGVMGLDANNNKVGTYRQLDITYQQNENEVYFSACKPFAEELGKSKGVKTTVVDRGISFWIRVDTYKMVPEGYELTEEDNENLKKQDYFISEGGDTLEFYEVSQVSWEKNGIRYGLMAYDWQGEKDELITMAQEIAFTE